MNKCRMCRGKGVCKPAHDLLARPPKEQREYLQAIEDGPSYPCPVCNGTGKQPENTLQDWVKIIVKE